MKKKGGQQLLDLDKYQLKPIIKIQSAFRRYKAYREFKRFKKILNYRRRIIQEFVETEEQYLYDISLIISDLKYPLRSSRLLTPEQSLTIFSNIEQIKKLNEQLYCQLYNSFQKYWHYAIIFDIIIKLSPFFKIYFQYCKNYLVGLNLLTQLRQRKQKLNDFFEAKESMKQFRNLKVNDFLIKPVQRLPKYVILLKDLIKHTPQNHPDFNNIKKALTQFQNVNIDNNDSMNKVLNNLKLIQIEGIVKSQLVQPGRQFVCQQAVSFLKINQIKDAIMYLFNDLIILTCKTRNGEQLQVKIRLSRDSIICQHDDLKYFKNMFLISGAEGECCTIACSSPLQKQKLMKIISKVVHNIGDKQVQKARLFINSNIKNESVLRKIQQTDHSVEVSVLGTQQRRSNKLARHTIYIIQVKIKNIRHKLFLRFRKLLSIQAFVIRKFNKIENLRTGNMLSWNAWQSSHQVRVIQRRKLKIQQFLQKLLMLRQMRQNGVEVLQLLGLPADFYTLPDKFRLSGDLQKVSSQKQSFFDRCSSTSTFQRYYSVDQNSFEDDQQSILRRKRKFRNTDMGNMQKSQQLTKKKLSVQELLHANQMYLGHFTRMTQRKNSLIENSLSNKKIKFTVLIFGNSLQLQQHEVYLSAFQRVQHLANATAKKLDLKQYKDFRFFLEEGDTERILDDDETLISLEQELNKFFSSAKLTFRKFIYINQDMEDRQIRADRVRMKLISNQILWQINKLNIRLNYQQYVIFGSLYLLLNNLDPDSSQLNFILRKFLPKSIYNEFSQNEWIIDVKKSYNIISIHLDTIWKNNCQKKQALKKQYFRDLDLEDIRDIMTQKQSLIRLAIINQIQKNFLYGIALIIVQVSHQTQLSIEGIGLTRNVWLGLRHNRILIISQNLQQILKQFSYTQTQDLQCYPGSLLIQFKKDDITIRYKLKTTRSFFLSQLILYYKKYNQIYERMTKDRVYERSVIQKTRQHMNSLVIQETQENLQQMKQNM